VVLVAEVAIDNHQILTNQLLNLQDQLLHQIITDQLHDHQQEITNLEDVEGDRVVVDVVVDQLFNL